MAPVSPALSPLPASAPWASDPEVLALVERMRQRCATADPLRRLPDVHPARIPRHIAFIMDGNGRWAQERGFPRIFGHRNGAAALRTVVEACGAIGVECVTFFSFSLENWKRPRPETDALMELCVMYCEGQMEALRRERIRVRFPGRRAGLPPEVRRAIERVEEHTRECDGPTLCLALNYGARAEIVDAARALAADASAGRLNPDDIDEEAFAARLTTAGVPDPDLLVRTAGELRVSNFLLWQISYAEIHVSPKFWPDFGIDDVHAAVRDFAARQRRFGDVVSDAEAARGAPGR